MSHSVCAAMGCLLVEEVFVSVCVCVCEIERERERGRERARERAGGFKTLNNALLTPYKEKKSLKYLERHILNIF